MKILLGVDDSQFTNEAIGFIQRTFRASGARVLVVAVAPVPVQVFSEIPLGAGAFPVEASEVEKRACEETAWRAEAELRGAGFETEARVLQGDAREMLVELARENRVDLMVVGSHGRTGLSKLLLGSVASYVVAHAPCNVLVVKRERV